MCLVRPADTISIALRLALECRVGGLLSYGELRALSVSNVSVILWRISRISYRSIQSAQPQCLAVLPVLHRAICNALLLNYFHRTL